MIEVQGVVVAHDGRYAIVRIDDAGCGRCYEPGGCGGVSVGSVFNAAPRTFRVRNDKGAAIGQCVVISIEEGVVRKGALFSYGFPLMALIFGAVFGLVAGGEVGSIVGGIAGLFIVWLFFRFSRVRCPSEPFIKD
ncbi:SoxR reducing system RseC family protein [Propionivibrio limicola]|uniref:SoxR reducing system RseC family protein n=1 Tax=Propionivibrio limicola TaxID=167645 RepID=UPI0012908DEF|nr:SoxR reducing system RseC family protein [Propionivibrio limicola]